MEQIRVAIAEDNKLQLEGLQKVIQSDSSLLIIAIAYNGIEAVEIAREHQPDVFLMDISMPEMDGIEATKRITRISPSTKILIVSEHDNRVFPIIRAGARGFLHKDNWSSREGLQAIHTVNSGGVIFNASIANQILLEFTSPITDLPQPSLKLEELTDREKEILEIMIAKGVSGNRTIAKLLNDKNTNARKISHSTVAAHLTSILKKLEMVDKAHLMWRTLKAREHILGKRGLADLVMLACNPPRRGLRKSWEPIHFLEVAKEHNIIDDELAKDLKKICQYMETWSSPEK